MIEWVGSGITGGIILISLLIVISIFVIELDRVFSEKVTNKERLEFLVKKECAYLGVPKDISIKIFFNPEEPLFTKKVAYAYTICWRLSMQFEVVFDYPTTRQTIRHEAYHVYRGFRSGGVRSNSFKRIAEEICAHSYAVWAENRDRLYLIRWREQ